MKNPISNIINYGIKNGLISELDAVYISNKIASKIGVDNVDLILENTEVNHLDVLNQLIEIADSNKVIDGESITERDLLDTDIMGELTPLPSTVINNFFALYENDKKSATDYFYKLSKDVYYIRTDRIAKNICWESSTKFGDLKITINLSKPEKDPKSIAIEKNSKSSSYPKCLLCKENEGYEGTFSHPARQNLRLIPFEIENEKWFLQYSPYSYFNEHCIALKGEHEPMVISKKTFAKLLSFVEKLPHYFFGSNCDIPIVGGSILSHDHYQGGSDSFPMESAIPWHEFTPFGYENVKAELLAWPLSVIRLKGKNKNNLVEIGDKILSNWKNYSDESLDIFNKTYDVHNAITPIARFRDGNFELDLVLRNNRVSDEHPDGIFHPHKNLHHIKKENIGLIEVMGLAVLPARLKDELATIKEILLNDLEVLETVKIHDEWINYLKAEYKNNKDIDLDEFLKIEVGKKFADVLADAGVFKNNELGNKGFIKFIDTLK